MVYQTTLLSNVPKTINDLPYLKGPKTWAVPELQLLPVSPTFLGISQAMNLLEEKVK